MTDAILVIGGGIAGINCAMNAAKYGAQVYLVDDTASIGGMMARLDKTFPPTTARSASKLRRCTRSTTTPTSKS